MRITSSLGKRISSRNNFILISMKSMLFVLIPLLLGFSTPNSRKYCEEVTFRVHASFQTDSITLYDCSATSPDLERIKILDFRADSLGVFEVGSTYTRCMYDMATPVVILGSDTLVVRYPLPSILRQDIIGGSHLEVDFHEFDAVYILYRNQ